VSAGNLGPKETRKRMIFGAVMLALGFFLAYNLFNNAVSLVVVFMIFWLGVLGLLQGQQKT
jgi:hypothetical protein